MAVITSDQLAQLQTLVATLVADKATADAATQTANAAVAAAASATAAAAQANLNEANADATATADLTAVQAFVDGLVNPTPTPTN